MFYSIVNSFFLVFASEMGDKTQLLAFALAARFKKPWPILGGILAATLLNHGLAAYAGAWVSHVFPPTIFSFCLGASFIVFGFWTLRPDTLDEKKSHSPWGAFVTTVILFFFAEMGDKTQWATVALGAKYQSVLAVTSGTTLGMLVADGLAVFLGERLADKVPMTFVRRLAAGLFFLFGVVVIMKAFAGY